MDAVYPWNLESFARCFRVHRRLDRLGKYRQSPNVISSAPCSRQENPEFSSGSMICGSRASKLIHANCGRTRSSDRWLSLVYLTEGRTHVGQAEALYGGVQGQGGNGGIAGRTDDLAAGDQARRASNDGVVQIRVTPKTRNPFTIKALSISGVTWKWHF